jgi:hypothetical protein
MLAQESAFIVEGMFDETRFRAIAVASLVANFRQSLAFDELLVMVSSAHYGITGRDHWRAAIESTLTGRLEDG